MSTMLDRIRMMQRGALAPAPIAGRIGFEVTGVESGRSSSSGPLNVTPTRWARSTAASWATWRMRQWGRPAAKAA
jgi:hypothetical protein